MRASSSICADAGQTNGSVAGLWPRTGRLYRLVKGLERRFLLCTDHVVSLTQAAVAEMRKIDYLDGRVPPISAIPTCANLDRFALIDGRYDPAQITLSYVGSAGIDGARVESRRSEPREMPVLMARMNAGAFSTNRVFHVVLARQPNSASFSDAVCRRRPIVAWGTWLRF